MTTEMARLLLLKDNTSHLLNTTSACVVAIQYLDDHSTRPGTKTYLLSLKIL